MRRMLDPRILSVTVFMICSFISIVVCSSDFEHQLFLLSIVAAMAKGQRCPCCWAPAPSSILYLGVCEVPAGEGAPRMTRAL